MQSTRKSTWENAFSVIGPQINADAVHVYPFDPRFPLAVNNFVFSGREPYRMNIHAYCEVVYVHSGQLVWQVLGRWVRQTPGDLFVMGPTLYHRITERTSPQVRATVLYFLPELIRSASAPGDDSAYLLPFLMQDASFQHIIQAKIGVPDQALDLMERMQTELTASTERGKLCAKTYLKMLMVLLIKHYEAYEVTTEAFNRRQQALQRLRPLFEFLEQHYHEPLAVPEGAAILGMSKSSFMRFFKSLTGQPFVSYVNRFRVAKAQALLTSTNKTVSEVSQEVGYCDQSYFGLMFRKMTRMTPSEYRRALDFQSKDKENVPPPPSRNGDHASRKAPAVVSTPRIPGKTPSPKQVTFSPL